MIGTTQAVDVYGNAFAVLQLLTNNKNLRSLSLHERCFWYKDGKEDAFLQIIMAISPTYLEKLELSFLPLDEDTADYNNNDFDEEKFQEQSKSLQKAMDVNRTKEPFSVLKEMSIIGAHNGATDISWLAFLKL